MRPVRLLIPLAAPLALLACDTTPEPPADSTTAMAPSVPPPASTAPAMTAGPTIALQPVGNSGVTGSAELTPMGDQTQVKVELTGAAAGPHAGHIHNGSCASLASVVVPLDEITVGNPPAPASMTTTVAVVTDSITDGRHAIAYHESGAPNHGPAIACGDIPARGM